MGLDGISADRGAKSSERFELNCTLAPARGSRSTRLESGRERRFFTNFVHSRRLAGPLLTCFESSRKIMRISTRFEPEFTLIRLPSRALSTEISEHSGSRAHEPGVTARGPRVAQRGKTSQIDCYCNSLARRRARCQDFKFKFEPISICFASSRVCVSRSRSCCRQAGTKLSSRTFLSFRCPCSLACDGRVRARRQRARMAHEIRSQIVINSRGQRSRS